MPPVVIERESNQLQRPSPALSSILIEIMINFHRGGVRGPAGSILDRVIVGGRGGDAFLSTDCSLHGKWQAYPKARSTAGGESSLLWKIFQHSTSLSLVQNTLVGAHSSNVKSFVFMRPHPRRVTEKTFFSKARCSKWNIGCTGKHLKMKRHIILINCQLKDDIVKKNAFRWGLNPRLSIR